MKVLILGCGAIGSYYGERLAKAGARVTVTARGKHLEALQRSLMVIHDGDCREQHVTAVSHTQLLENTPPETFDVIIITLKSTQTKTVVDELGNWLARSGAPILSLQNGVDNEPYLARHIPQATLWGGLAVKIGGGITAPGVATTTGIAQVIMGPWPGSGAIGQVMLQLQSLWESQGVPVDCSTDIRRELWKKLIINNGVNPLSAIMRLDTYALTHDPELASIVFNAMCETSRAASYDGIDISQQEVQNMFELIKGFNAIRTSMLIDVEQGREPELDAIMKSVIVRCERLGQPAATNISLWHQLTDREVPDNLDP